MTLDAQRLQNRLQQEIKVYVFETLDSTNEECRRRIAAGELPCLVLARRQTGGRGRSGRSFFSPEGGLYLSLALPLPPDAVGLTCRAAVVTAQAVETVTGCVCGIKWVNDLYYQGKKVCGILAEAVPGGVIIGVGINLAPCPVPPELAEVVGFLDCGDQREALAAEIAEGLLAADLSDRSFMEEYRQRSVVIGRELECCMGDRSFSARALGIDDDGGLVVLSARGRETLRFGEVKLKGDFR